MFSKPPQRDDQLKTIAEALVERRWRDAEKELDCLARTLVPAGSLIGNKEIALALNAPVHSGGATLLAIAVLSGAPRSIVDTLVTRGASEKLTISATVCKTPDTQLSLLHLACANGHFHHLPLLLHLGLDPNARSEKGHLPLTLFLSGHPDIDRYTGGLPKIMQLLHKYGCVFDDRDPTGKTALQYLADQERWDLVRTVLKLSPGLARGATTSELTKPEVQAIAAEVVGSPKVIAAHRAKLLDDLSLLFKVARSVQDGEVVCTSLSIKLHSLLSRALFDRNGASIREFHAILSELETNRDLLGKENIVRALNTPHEMGSFSSTFLFRAIEVGASRDIIAKLLNLGADPNLQSVAGIRYINEPVRQVPLHLALRSGDLSQAGDLINQGARLAEVNDKEVRSILLNRHIRDFDGYSSGIEAQNALSPVRLLERAVKNKHVYTAFFGEAGHEMLLESTFNSLSPRAQRKVAEKFPDEVIFRNLKPLGPSDKLEEALEGVFEKYAHLPEIKELSESVSSAEEALQQCFSHACLDAALILLKAGCPLPASYYAGKPPSRRSDEEVAALRQEVIADTEALETKYFGGAAAAKLYHPKMYHLDYDDGARGMAKHSAAHLLAIGGSVRDALRLANAISGFDEVGLTNDSTGRDLAELLPQLLHRYPVSVGANILHWLEYGGARYRSESLKNLPEFFALFLHPEVISETAESARGSNLGILTAGLSSLTDFIGRNAEVTGSAVNAWRAIANISFGHRRYRYDAARTYGVDESGKRVVTLPSVFEAFGGKRLSHVNTKHPFHSGYAFFGSRYKGSAPILRTYKALASGDILVRYRAGDVIFSPDLGYLFVRNSSLVFGRDLTPSVAYYVSPAVRNADIAGRDRARWERKPKNQPSITLRPTPDMIKAVLTLTPKALVQEGIPILHPSLYSIDYPGPSSGIARVEKLLEKHKAFEAAYRRFTFDTALSSAWEEDDHGNSLLVGAFNSQGFKHRIASLRASFDDAKYSALTEGEEFTPPHALELYNPELPPLVPYARLVVDEEVLAIFEKISQRGWESGQSDSDTNSEADPESEEDRELSDEESSGVYAFLNIALRNQAELIVVPNQV